MRTVTLEVSSREKINQRFLRAFEGEPQGAFISFESPELLFKVISGKRWDLLKGNDWRRSNDYSRGCPPNKERREGRTWRCSSASKRRNIAENRQRSDSLSI